VSTRAEIDRVCRSSAAKAEMFEPVFTAWNRAAYGLGILCWLAALGYFWLWWAQPIHIVSWPTFLLVTLILAWVTLLPAYFILIFLDARQVRSSAGLPKGRVAMVATKAPSFCSALPICRTEARRRTPPPS